MFTPGVRIARDAAPPSDHDVNAYPTPPTVCAGAWMVRCMPTTLSKDVGELTGCPSSRSCSVAGLAASVRRTRCGNTSRCTVWLRPPLSVTVR